MARLSNLKTTLGALPHRLSGLTREERRRDQLAVRDRTLEYRAWYKTAAWQGLRLKILRRDGYRCRITGELLTGKHPAPNSPVVDHIIPHRGNPILFWDENNLQTLSKAYHDSQKQSMERRRP